MPLLARKPREHASYLRGWEHRRESDEAVEVNLRPDEVALFRKMRARFKGTPHERLEKFRHYLHDHPEALRGHVSKTGEERAKALVKARENRAAVGIPCEPPYRFRTKAACKPERTPHTPRWSLLGGRKVLVPCGPPHRARSKELCHPKETYWKAPAEEPSHAFEGLL